MYTNNGMIEVPDMANVWKECREFPEMVYLDNDMQLVEEAGGPEMAYIRMDVAMEISNGEAVVCLTDALAFLRDKKGEGVSLESAINQLEHAISMGSI